ncbi:MAG: hypothetical protein ACPG5T_08505, partial [Endozoicomonas sp.]
DFLYGNHENNVFILREGEEEEAYGRGGDDYFFLSQGTHLISGGSGSDTVDYSTHVLPEGSRGMMVLSDRNALKGASWLTEFEWFAEVQALDQEVEFSQCPNEEIEEEWSPPREEMTTVSSDKASSTEEPVTEAPLSTDYSAGTLSTSTPASTPITSTVISGEPSTLSETPSLNVTTADFVQTDTTQPEPAGKRNCRDGYVAYRKVPGDQSGTTETQTTDEMTTEFATTIETTEDGGSTTIDTADTLTPLVPGLVKDRLYGIENSVASSGDDLIFLTVSGAMAKGFKGNDQLFDLSEGGALMGGEGADHLYASRMKDSKGTTTQGGAGEDTHYGGPGDDKMIADQDADLMQGESGKDIYVVYLAAKGSRIVDPDYENMLVFKGDNIASSHIVLELNGDYSELAFKYKGAEWVTIDLGPVERRIRPDGSLDTDHFVGQLCRHFSYIQLV